MRKLSTFPSFHCNGDLHSKLISHSSLNKTLTFFQAYSPAAHRQTYITTVKERNANMKPGVPTTMESLLGYPNFA